MEEKLCQEEGKTKEDMNQMHEEFKTKVEKWGSEKKWAAAKLKIQSCHRLERMLRKITKENFHLARVEAEIVFFLFL